MTPTPPPSIKRAPDLEAYGRAWRITIGPLHPEQEACIGSYVVHAPNGNPFWPWYLVAAVHIRPIEGSPSPHLKFPGATHEFLIGAFDPRDYPKIDPDRHVGVGLLRPLDLCHQVTLRTDEQARAVLTLLVRAIVGGDSPDQDFRSLWVQRLDVTARHFFDGKHDPAGILG